MLTYTHNHAPGILLWHGSCHRNKNPNSKSFFNYDANLTKVITIELKVFGVFFAMLVSLYCVDLAVALSMLKTSVKFWGTSFKFCLRPCPYLFLSSTSFHVLIYKACCVLKLFLYPHINKIYIFKIYKFKLQTRIYETKWVMLCLFSERAHF